MIPNRGDLNPVALILCKPNTLQMFLWYQTEAAAEKDDAPAKALLKDIQDLRDDFQRAARCIRYTHIYMNK